MVYATGRRLSLVLAVVLATTARSDEPATWKVERGDVIRTHAERGVFEAVNQVDIICNLRAPEPGKPAGVVRRVIDDGAMVKKGDRILQLDDVALRDAARAQSTVVAVKDAEARLASDAVKAATAAARLDEALARGKLELAELRLKMFQGNREGDTKKLRLRVS